MVVTPKIKRKIIRFALQALLIWPTMVFAFNDSTILETKVLPNKLGRYQHIKLYPNRNIEVHAVLLNQNYHARLYVQQVSNQYFAKTLDDLSQDENFFMGINGGFFTPNFNIAGLYISEGKIIKKPARDSLLTSCVGIDLAGKIRLGQIADSCLSDYYAIQTGPVMIKDGKIEDQIKVITQKKEFFAPHRRTILAKTRDDQLLVMVTSAVTLLELAEMLIDHPEVFGVQGIQTAIDLDGGSSTGMYIRFDDKPFYFEEFKRVKTLIFFD